MRIALHAIFLLSSVILPINATGQNATLERSAVALDVNNISALEYTGDGKWYRFGQAVEPGKEWPEHDVSDLAITIDFTVPSQRVVMTRVETKSARARPPLTQKVDERLSQQWAWGLVPSASARRDAALDVQPQPNARDSRISDVWSTPQGFVKAALMRRATVVDVAGGVEVSFSIDGRPFKGMINLDGDVERVTTILPDSVLGDADVTYRFADYRDFSGTRFPTRIAHFQGGFLVSDYTVKSARRVPAEILSVPEAVSQLREDPSHLDVLQVAEGVYVLRRGNYNSVVIEQTRRVVVIEAPLDETRSFAVLKKIKSLIPGKPVKFVVNTHSHFDHSGGLRTFVAEGVTVVTHSVNRQFYEAAWQRPRTLQPDQLSQHARKPVFKLVTETLTIPDALRPIVVYPVIGAGHATGLVMVYLPREKFLIEADQFAMPAEGARPRPPVNPYNVNLLANIERLNLDVRLIVPLHGRVGHMSDLRDAVGVPTMKPASSGCQQEAFYC